MNEVKTNLGSSVKFSIILIGIVVLSIILMELRDIFIPFAIAYFLFFVFKPFNDYLKRKKIPGFVAVLLDIIIIALILYGAFTIIAASFGQFARQAPFYENKLNHLAASFIEKYKLNQYFDDNFSPLSLLSQINLSSLAGEIFSSTVSLMGTVFFILFFFVFINSGHQGVYDALYRYFHDLSDTNISNSSRNKFNLEEAFKSITEQIQKYIIAKFFICLATGLFVGLALWIYGLDFVVVWATLTFLLNFIPTIGSAIAVILPAGLSLAQFESPGYTALIILTMIIIQTIMGNIIEPKIFGDRLGLNPLVILLSLLLWGYLWGVVGMILCVPLTAILKIIISNSNSRTLIFISDLIDNK